MHRVIKQGRLISSENVVKIPDAVNPDEVNELSENSQDETDDSVIITNSDEKSKLEAEELRSKMMQEKIIEQAQDFSRKIMQNASVEREKIINQALEDAKKIRTEAKESAYRQVLENKHLEISSAISEVENLMDELQVQHSSFIKVYEDNIFNLSMDIVRKILRTSIEEHKELMIPLVKEAVSSVKNADWISVQVSDKLPGLIELLKTNLSAYNDPHKLEIIAADLPVDACIVHTSDGIVDASACGQLDNLEAVYQKSQL